jgi:hypothetical protein
VQVVQVAVKVVEVVVVLVDLEFQELVVVVHLYL